MRRLVPLLLIAVTLPLFAVLVFALASACARREARPPIILISIDTLRADYVSSLGGHVSTPNIDALAHDGTVYRNAWSHSPLTLPSHVSILTGLLPPEHGVRDNAGYRLDASHPTLASELKKRGYQTGAAVSAYVLRHESGLAAGFDDYDDAIGMVDGAPQGLLQRDGARTEMIAERWIAAHDGEPFFFFLHLYEPHTPYTPTYAADVQRADAIVGSFMAFLRSRHLYDRALIVLLSDHGEGLMDHGEQEHGVLLYRESLQVPLIVKPPQSHARRDDDALVGLTDVKPMILDDAGRSSSRLQVYSESLYARIHLGCSELRSVVEGKHHVIDGPHPEVFALIDRAERTNVIDRQRRAYASAREAMAKIGGAFTPPEAIDAEEKKKLAALGYVSAGTDAGGSSRDPRACLADLAQLKELAALHGAAAVARLESMLGANPHWSDVRDQLGAAYDAAGDHRRAARIYEDGIRMTPRLAPQFALSAAASLLDAHQFDEAAAHAHAAESSEPAGAALLLGEIALARGDLDAAQREAILARSFPANRGHALFLEARIAAARRDYAHALELLRASDDARRATNESPPRGAHYVAGDALAHAGRLREAESEFEAAIAADPHEVQPYADLALLHLIAHDRLGALRTIERMAAASPQRDTYLFAAESLDKWGEHAAAAQWRARAK
jgi:tetratricopeptide (TPR) repeat protein